MKRGQEEIVGFVAIIVIVAIVVVFFLGINLRQTESDLGESQALSQFIESSKKFTSECDLGLKERYASMDKLIVECYRNSQSTCFNGVKVCEEYEKTMKKILNSSWKAGEDLPIKGYIWNVTYEKASKIDEIKVIIYGNCTGQYQEEDSLSPDPIGAGTFVSRFRTCF